MTHAASASRLPPLLLVTLRVYLGAVLFVSGLAKLTSGDFPTRMGRFLETALGLQTGDPGLPVAFAFYRPFLEVVVLPNLAVFATLVMGGELLAGLALVAGLGTRLAACVAAFLLVNYMLAWGATPWSQAAEPAMLLIAVALLTARAGRHAGLDALLVRRWGERWAY